MSGGRLRAWLAGATTLLAACAPGESLTPAGPPYVAIVSRLDLPAGVSPGREYRYRLQELSGTLGVDTLLAARPQDTLILSVPPASYRVTLDGVPANCGVRDGLERVLFVPEGSNTTIARYFVNCRAMLTVVALSEGTPPPGQPLFVTLEGPAAARELLLPPGDSVRVDDLVPGSYVARLGAVPAACEVVSDGERAQRIEVPPAGGAVLGFRIRCSSESNRPAILTAAGDVRDGALIFYFRAFDPDRDIERYAWDVTDCAGTSRLPGGARLRRGLSSGRTANGDTITVIGGFELPAGIPLGGACLSLRVEDQPGSVSLRRDVPLGRSRADRAPGALNFDARYIGITAVRTTLEPIDAQGDLVGLFGAARLRDGVLAPPDGADDIGTFNVPGYLGVPLPDIPLGTGRIQWGDVLGVIVYLVDAEGNVLRVEDPL